MRQVLAALVLAALALAAAPHAQALSKPRIIGELGLAAGPIAYLEPSLWVYDAGRGVLAEVRDGVVAREVELGARARAIQPYGGGLLILTARSLTLYNPGTGGKETVELEGNPVSLTLSGDSAWIALQPPGLILEITLPDLTPVRRIPVEVLGKEGSIAAGDGALWAVLEDGRTLLRLEPETGERRAVELDAAIAYVAALGERAAIALADDTIRIIGPSLQAEERIELERGASSGIRLTTIGERLFYVSEALGAIGEIEGGEAREVRVGKSLVASAPAPDRIWFITSGGELGWVWLSRPPERPILQVRPIGEGNYVARAWAEDPDGDLEKLYLTVLEESEIPNVPPTNKTVEMKKDEDGWWAAGFTVRDRDVQVLAVAVDAVGNRAESKPLTIRAEKPRTEATTITPTEEQPQGQPSPGADLFAVGSSLTLLIPIILALLFFRRRRRRRRR